MKTTLLLLLAARKTGTDNSSDAHYNQLLPNNAPLMTTIMGKPCMYNTLRHSNNSSVVI